MTSAGTRPNIWFTSDQHIGHGNILNFVSSVDGKPVRPGIRDVVHMHERIIDGWNESIKDDDVVYCGGDIGWKKNSLEYVMPKLNGRKRLILGNHDTLPMRIYQQFFQKIVCIKEINDGHSAVIASHYPLHEDSLPWRYKDKSVNVHGHIHERVLDDPRYVNMCVEPNDYKPIHLDTLLAKARAL